MPRRMQVTEAAHDLGAMIERLSCDHVSVILEREETPVAVLLSVKDYERYQRFVMDQFWETVDKIHEQNADADPDEVMREVTLAVEEVRQERYERQLRTQGDR